MDEGTPFLVAHRGGNDLGALRRAEALGVRLVEADVRLHRGVPEVLHARRVRPLPVAWDAGRISSTRDPLLLAEVLAAAAPRTEMLLDLKGRSARLSKRVLREIEPYAASRRFSVCSRSWTALEPFAEHPRIRVVYSIGSPAELGAFLLRFGRSRVAGVSIRESLVDRHVAERLRGVSDAVLCWTVNSATRARELAACGVDGLTTDDVELLRLAVAATRAVPGKLAAAA